MTAAAADNRYTAAGRSAGEPDNCLEGHWVWWADIPRSAGEYHTALADTPYSAEARWAAAADIHTAELSAGNRYTAAASAGIRPVADTGHPQAQEPR